MRKFQFEYYGEKIAFQLFGLTILVFILEAFLFAGPLRNTIAPLYGVVLTMALPAILFLVLKSKIRKEGAAILSDDCVEMILSDKEQKINFKEINQYYIYHSKNGPVFILYLVNKEKLKIKCNYYFCKGDSFNLFLDDFKKYIDVFNKENNYSISELKTILF